MTLIHKNQIKRIEGIDSCSTSYVLYKFTYSFSRLLNSREGDTSICILLMNLSFQKILPFLLKSLGLSTLRKKNLRINGPKTSIPYLFELTSPKITKNIEKECCSQSFLIYLKNALLAAKMHPPKSNSLFLLNRQVNTV